MNYFSIKHKLINVCQFLLDLCAEYDFFFNLIGSNMAKTFIDESESDRDESDQDESDQDEDDQHRDEDDQNERC